MLFQFVLFSLSILCLETGRDYSQIQVVTNSTKAFCSNNRMPHNLFTPKHCSVELLFSLNSLISMIQSEYLSVPSVFLTLSVNSCLTYAGYNSLIGKYPMRDFVYSSKYVAIKVSVSVRTGVPLISDISSIVLRHSSSLVLKSY